MSHPRISDAAFRVGVRVGVRVTARVRVRCQSCGAVRAAATGFDVTHA